MKDYEKRMIDEYEFIKTKAKKLQILVNNYKDGTLSFKPKCSLELLERQLHIQSMYLDILEERARIENVNLD